MEQSKQIICNSGADLGGEGKEWTNHVPLPINYFIFCTYVEQSVLSS